MRNGNGNEKLEISQSQQSAAERKSRQQQAADRLLTRHRYK